MNKIIHSIQLLLLYSVVFLLTPLVAAAQDGTLNKYGLWVIKKTKQLQKTVLENPAKQMMDIKNNIPDVVLDLRYAGTNNFMHKKLYPAITTTYLRRPASDSLKVIQQQLNQSGFGLKIFDAYRPYAVTEKMWEPVQDDRYAADPKKGSGHNRGVAVDLTIINLTTKEELDMGTGFDNFSDTAHHTFNNLPEEILQNRLLLKTVMEQHGFKALDTEWWHYSLSNAKDFELLNIPFDAFTIKEKIKKNKLPVNAKRNTD
jgi:zinc D-Ala-D-Ala dipeptidase